MKCNAVTAIVQLVGKKGHLMSSREMLHTVNGSSIHKISSLWLSVRNLLRAESESKIPFVEKLLEPETVE